MDDIGHAQRAEAWTWAARTLGQELDSQRLDGLIELTENVGVENLKPAIQAVMRSMPSDFLPSVGLVIAAANRIAGEHREEARVKLFAHREDRARIEARSKPCTPEQLQEIRDAIAGLARKEKTGSAALWTAKLKTLDDSRGIEAARKASRERGTDSPEVAA